MTTVDRIARAITQARDLILDLELHAPLADLADADREQIDRLLAEVAQRAGSIRLALDEERTPTVTATKGIG